MNIPGRTSTAKNEIVFKTMLPALGFNTYYFQIKSLFIHIDINDRKPKVTHNEICTLENQVRMN